MQLSLATRINDMQMFEKVWTDQYKTNKRNNHFGKPPDLDSYVYQIKPLMGDIIVIK